MDLTLNLKKDLKTRDSVHSNKPQMNFISLMVCEWELLKLKQLSRCPNSPGALIAPVNYNLRLETALIIL